MPNDYRPIALTSCFWKTYERLTNKRFVFILESKNILYLNQCGFRIGRSILDHVVRLETVIREVFVQRQHCVSTFSFDLEKAYDTTWGWAVRRHLYSYGIRGRALSSIQSFLSARSFRVRSGTTLSKPFIQETDVPQGGVRVSPYLQLKSTLFA